MEQDSPTSFIVSDDAELANEHVTADATTQEGEPSAADYDPTMDMQEDKIRQTQQTRKDEVNPADTYSAKDGDRTVLLPKDGVNLVEPLFEAPKKLKDEFDMFADEDDVDMFAEGAPASKTIQNAKQPTKSVPVPSAKALDMTLLDDWDDPDGYYKVTLGELLDNRYHVQSNLGKGMFSGVVRATDQRTKRLVAIKIIRNNETM